VDKVNGEILVSIAVTPFVLVSVSKDISVELSGVTIVDDISVTLAVPVSIIIKQMYKKKRISYWFLTFYC
jgi:hypothetical protein